MHLRLNLAILCLYLLPHLLLFDMLIEFSVSNFLSFRERQTFSMVAATRLKKKENVLKPPVRGERLPNLLKVAAVYGPNASGKSNLIKAIGLIHDLIGRKPDAKSGTLPVSPFRFDPQLANQPSSFEFHFIAEGTRYHFEFDATPDRITKEKLIFFPKGKETLLYNREYTNSGETYNFGQLEGGRDLHEVWRKLTGPRSLFMTQSVANSNEELQQLRVPYEWFRLGLNVVPRDMESLANVVQSLANIHPELHIDERVTSFLKEVDIPVTNIRFEHNDGGQALFTDEEINEHGGENRELKKSIGKVKTTLTHKSKLGEALFDFSEESDGTRNLIGFSLPWTLMSADKVPRSLAFLVDELDSSLHPQIVANLIKQFLKLDTGSQLIFTTHDTHLMDTKLLRRDQIWLTERDVNGATQLRSIHDFEGREGEDIEKRYYEGRYRSLPILS